MPGFNQVFGGSNIFPVQPSYSQLNYAVNVALAWPIEQAVAGVPVVTSIMDLNPSAGGLSATLPDARRVSQGFTAVFNNISANTTTITDNLNNSLVAPTPGTIWFLYLVDNTTQQGTWRAFQYGVGVSAPNAASLAGLGLKAITTTLNERIVINQQVANYPIQSADRASCIEWAGGSGGIFTLPSAATVGSDWFCYIKNAGSGILNLTVLSGTLDGGTTKSFNPNDSAIIICDGTNYITLGYGQAITAIFSFVSIAVTGGNLVLSGAQLNRVSYKFTGVLTANQTITVPSSIQQYWVDNETTGAFTLTVTTGAGSSVTVGQGQRAILYCDGINVVNAVSGGAAPTFPDGTAAAPSITFTSDLTLGLYKAGAEVLGFATAGLARGSISAAGNWTINTPSSGTALTVNGVPLGNFITFGDGTRTGTIGCNGATALQFGTTTNHELDIFTNNATRIAISNVGNITIVTPSSGAALTVNALAGSYGIIVNVPAASVKGIQVIAAAGGVGEIDIFSPVGQAAAVRLIGNGNSVGGGDCFIEQLSDNSIAWGTNSNANASLTTNGSVRVVTSGAGNVTINAPASGDALTINAVSGGLGINVQAAAAAAGNSIFHAGATQSCTISIQGNGAGPVGTNDLLIQQNGSGNVFFNNNTAGGSISIGTNLGNTRITINSGGNVSINAPSSGTALAVNGISSGGTGIITWSDGIGGGYMGTLGGHAPYIGNPAAGVFNLVANGTAFFRVNSSAPNIAGLGPTSGTFIDMTPDSGSWVTTLSGIFAVNPTGTLKWEKQGTQVTIWADANITGTSNAGGGITCSGLPAAITPSSARIVPCVAISNGGAAQQLGNANIQPGGTIILGVATASGSNTIIGSFFGASLTCGIFGGWSITYSL